MKVAIISDTHDNMDKIERAMMLIEDSGVQHVIHAGDYVAPFSLKLIMKHLGTAQFTGVFGNNDGEKKGLSAIAGGAIHKAPHCFAVEGVRFYLTHDLMRLSLNKLIKEHDVIIHGHTHNAEIEQHGTALVINPGACCGIMARFSSIAMLSLPDMHAEIIRL